LEFRRHAKENIKKREYIKEKGEGVVDFVTTENRGRNSRGGGMFATSR
jgi:hypothetical protein